MNNKHRFISVLHNYGTDKNPMYTDWEDIVDTHTGQVVYTQHSIMCGHLLKEINNPEAHEIEDVDQYIKRVIKMEKGDK